MEDVADNTSGPWKIGGTTDLSVLRKVPICKKCQKLWRFVRVDLIFSMRGLYINSNVNPLTNFTSSSRSTEFKDIFPWNIFQMIAKTIPISTRIIISYAMK